MKRKRRRSADGVIEFRHDSILRLRPPSITYADDRDDGLSSPTESAISPPEVSKEMVTNAPVVDVGAKNESEGSQIGRKRKTYYVQKKGKLHDVCYAVVHVRDVGGIGVYGCMWMSVLNGCCDVFGATLSRDDGPVYVVSAPLAPFAVRIVPRKNEREGRRKVQSGPGADVHLKVRKQVEAKLQVGNNRCVVLLTQAKVNGQRGSAVDLGTSLKPFLAQGGFRGGVDGEELFVDVGVVRSGSLFREWTEWGGLTRELDEFGNVMRVMICGGGGVGKSTMVRCLCNYLLGRFESVVLIDTDVGQPEMNLSGVVAAHVVSVLRVGGRVGWVRSVPVAARFLGETTAREDVDLYAKYVEEVVAEGVKIAGGKNWPVVVNSSGWIGGVGAKLLHHLVDVLQPTHVVRMILGEVEKEVLMEVGGRVEGGGIVRAPFDARDKVFTSAMQRELMMASYFCGELAVGRVYNVLMRDVQVVQVGEGGVDDLYGLLNASVVALARKVGGEWDVRGFGIVRGVDRAKGVLYVCTPVPGEVLQQCEGLLISGGVQLPHAMFLAWGGVEGTTERPYVVRGVVSTGESMRSRANLSRR